MRGHTRRRRRQVGDQEWPIVTTQNQQEEAHWLLHDYNYLETFRSETDKVVLGPALLSNTRVSTSIRTPSLSLAPHSDPSGKLSPGAGFPSSVSDAATKQCCSVCDSRSAMSFNSRISASDSACCSPSPADAAAAISGDDTTVFT